MVGMIWLVWFAVIVYRVATRDRSKPRAKHVTQWPLVIGFFIWIGAAASIIFNLPIDGAGDVVLMAAIAIICFPSIWIRLLIRMGWVRASYYASFMILRRHGESLRAGAAFNALRALENKPNVSAEAGQLRMEWIRSKACEISKSATSGAMMMWLLLEFSRDSDRFARPLSDMYHLKKGSTPTSMARYAFKMLLAYWLAKKDWDQIARISNQWRKSWRLPLATLVELHYHKTNGSGRVITVVYWYFLLRCGRPNWLHRLPSNTSARAEGECADWHELKVDVVVAALEGRRSEFQGEEALKLQSEWRHEWRERAEALHCRELDAALADIEMTLGTLYQSESSLGGGDEHHSHTDYALTRVRYLANAICTRQESGGLQKGMIEFQEWLNLSEVFEELMADPSVGFQAFSILEYPVWNWMADLWNIKAEKSLAYFLCSYMHPHASKFGSESRLAYREVLVGAVT